MVNSNCEENVEITNLKTLDTYLKSLDNSETNSYFSSIPDVCKNSPCLVGIDEAGRGPVLGPMVYGIAFLPLEEAEVLNILNCADSKSLSEKKRENIFEDICFNSYKIGWAVDIISPNKLSNNMLSKPKISLTQISADSAVGLIKSIISAGVKVENIFVDALGASKTYETYLQSVFPECKVRVEIKADDKYPVVSAASICAKVVRDHVIKTWHFKEGFDFTHQEFGSGYPADPVTKKFLANNCDKVFGFPQLVRFSWSTTQKILKEKAHDVESEEPDEEDSTKSSVKKVDISSFFTSTKKKVDKPMHKFFKHRCLTRNVDL